MVMYRAHCQRILDSVVRANFNEVTILSCASCTSYAVFWFRNVHVHVVYV